MRMPIGKRVQSRPEDHHLLHAASDRVSGEVLGEPAAGSEKCPQHPRQRVLLARVVRPDVALGDAGDRQGERIVEDDWPIEELMCRAAAGDARGGSARDRFDHAPYCRRTQPAIGFLRRRASIASPVATRPMVAGSGTSAAAGVGVYL